MQNIIDKNTAEQLSFLTHTAYIAPIGNFLAAEFSINEDIYFEMEVSSRQNAYENNLLGLNQEGLADHLAILGVIPNPDFVFFPKPIENIRYLMYRYIKSIFQIPNNSLHCFSNDSEFKAFCNNNNIDYIPQQWFKRIYIEGSYTVARSYILKCSLVFQNLYFPKDLQENNFSVTLHDAKKLQQSVNFKSDFSEIFEILKRNNITKFYHFTDKNNIESIKRYGLLSADELHKKGIRPKYASSERSRYYDKEMGISDYVRLSLVKGHPMMYSSMTATGLTPIILEINPIIALMPNVYFANTNTLAKDAQIGSTATDLTKLDFTIIHSNKAYYELNSIKDKKAYQAEILIKQRVGQEMILNLKDF